jgi:hypothetical protein
MGRRKTWNPIFADRDIGDDTSNSRVADSFRGTWANGFLHGIAKFPGGQACL